MSLNRINDFYEPTPEGFHQSVEQRLNELRHAEAGQRAAVPAKRSLRWVAVLAACLALLGGTALALRHFGVLYFLTERVWMGDPVDASAVVQPVSQSCDSKLLNASVQDAYWDGETLSVTVSVHPKGDYAFYTETDRGADGESFDKIWWSGEIMPYEEWRAGRQAVKLRLPTLKINGERATGAWDWVQDEQGETMLIEGSAADMTRGAELTILLECVLEETDETEKAALTATLPPMTKGEPKE